MEFFLYSTFFFWMQFSDRGFIYKFLVAKGSWVVEILVLYKGTNKNLAWHMQDLIPFVNEQREFYITCEIKQNLPKKLTLG